MARTYGQGLYGDCLYGGADVGDPAEAGFVTFPGTAGNFLSVANEPALNPGGSLSIGVRMRPVDWTPGVDDGLIGKFAASGQLSYYLALLTSGLLQWVWSSDGSAVMSATADESLAGQPLDWLWVYATFAPDNGLGGNDTRFWTSPDGATWDQLGTTQTQAGTTSIFASTSPLEIASLVSGAAANFEGDIGDASLRDGFGVGGIPGGTEVFGFGNMSLKFVDPAATSFEARTGQTVIVNRSGSPSTTITPSGLAQCDLVTLAEPCPDLQPIASGPHDRLVGAVPCPPGGEC